MPRAGPPVPTSGPLPSAGAGCAVGETGGSALGVAAGATSLTRGVLVAGLLSPPLLPITGAPVAFGRTRKPIRSAGTGGDFRPPKTVRNAFGVMTYLRRSTTRTTCAPIEASRYAGGRRRPFASG